VKKSMCLSFILILDFFALLFFPLQTEAAFDSLRVEQEAKFQFKTRAALVLVSFEEYLEDLDPTPIPDRQIKWNWPREEEVQFRVMEIRPSLSYMQLENIDDIFSRDIRNVGRVGWISHKIGEETHEVYTPSSFWEKDKKPAYESYKIVLMPNRELTEVFYGFGRVNEEDGKILDFSEEQSLARYYPAGRPIELFLQKSKLGVPGFYYMEVGATFRDGGSTSLEIWFYHSDEN
jgi:hypothetical protein